MLYENISNKNTYSDIYIVFIHHNKYNNNNNKLIKSKTTFLYDIVILYFISTLFNNTVIM